ncbi:MAG: GNAT family N-acetyltransferase [Oscillospiraceae bacterium]|nr:GNAT family N-acetyltransferase [Oscillospiraceae bacterium]
MSANPKAKFDFDVLREELTRMGAWRVLPADLSALPREQRSDLPRGISISVAVDLSIVNRLAVGVSPEYVAEYDRLNVLLDRLAETAAERLRAAGYRAIALSRENTPRDRTKHTTLLPHKTVATRAGLGWIGKNALLVTLERGAAIRLTSVLTDAPLPIAEPINESQCGDCDICLRNCPGGAILGPNWSIEKRRDDFFNVLACRKACIQRTWKTKPGRSLCGLCITVCPHTRKAIRDAGIEYVFPAPVFAGPEDVDEILTLQKLCFQREADRVGNPNITPMTETREDLLSDFSNAADPLFLLKLVEDRRIVGSVRAREKNGTVLIGRLIVHPDYRKRGYGRKLMEAIEACFYQVRFELFTGEHNTENLRFYRNLGYLPYDMFESDGVRLVRLEKGPASS